MQQRFAFACADLERWQMALRPLLETTSPLPGRRPLGALIKSLISAETYDAVSLAAYHRLCWSFGTRIALARSRPDRIHRVIADVTHADVKAGYLAETMRRIGCERPDFDLAFLADLPLGGAVAWLEDLPGVGRKVAASTLNASRLRRPIFIADTHIVRVLQRLHFIDARADYRIASEQVTAGAPDWSGDDFLDFHRVTKRLGQRFCRPAMPRCGACPLASYCPSRDRS